jgi:hypothetical protein
MTTNTITVGKAKKIANMKEVTVMKVMERVTKTSYEKKIPALVDLKITRAQDFSSKAIAELSKIESCPCCVNDLYSLGASLQSYIGTIYFELADMHQGLARNQYEGLALSQLEGKAEIKKLANDNLNQLLSYFYNNGGPIMEAPVTEQTVNVIQPIFNGIMDELVNQVTGLANAAVKGRMNVNDLELAINRQISSTYSATGYLFQVKEMKNAVEELINVRKAISYN